MKKADVFFNGKQPEEVILHVIHPHWLMLACRLLTASIVSAVLCLAWWRSYLFFPKIFIVYKNQGFICIGIISFFYLIWQIKYFITYRAYITSWRMVRVEAMFPITEQRRTIFWKDAVKARDMANSFIWRLIKIGTLEVTSHLVEGFERRSELKGSEMTVNYVRNFVELTNYIDRIIHLQSEDPALIKDMEPFDPSKSSESYKPINKSKTADKKLAEKKV